MKQKRTGWRCVGNRRGDAHRFSLYRRAPDMSWTSRKREAYVVATGSGAIDPTGLESNVLTGGMAFLKPVLGAMMDWAAALSPQSRGTTPSIWIQLDQRISGSGGAIVASSGSGDPVQLLLRL